MAQDANREAAQNQHVAICHAGARDNYELAKAFCVGGRNVHLVTDFYAKPGRVATKLAALTLSEEKVNRRYRSDISVNVHSGAWLEALDWSERLFKRNSTLYKLRSQALARKCANVVRKFSPKYTFFYYNSGLSFFPPDAAKLTTTVLFQMHPHIGMLREIYGRYRLENPAAYSFLAAEEEELSKDEVYLNDLAKEAEVADKVICTSTFVRRSLELAGIDKKKIVVVPYGCTPYLPTLPNVTSSSGRIRLAYVGQFVARKGIYELIDAVADVEQAYLEIYTRDDSLASRRIAELYPSAREKISVRKIIDPQQLWASVAESDFIILPSLAEGFGLVLTEGLAAGVPIIGSTNSVASDILERHAAGYLINEISSQEIKTVISKALNESQGWRGMRETAARASKGYTWDNFGQELRNAFQ